MRILVIGGGGREHALVWRLAREKHQMFAAPGNPGIAQLARCFPASSIEDYLAVANTVDAELTVVGPEAPLVAGVVDRFRAAGRLIVGPTAAAARLEGSKAFSKDFMLRAGVPTARYQTADDIPAIWSAIDELKYPIVLKADGLAAGKGVVIAQDRQAVEAALPTVAGTRVVVEEFLDGEEVSFIALCDGKGAIPLELSQDHKTVFDNDQGPNTGGMGAYADPSILSLDQWFDIMSGVVQPTLSQMESEGCPFTGFLYAGLMMTPAGPKVLEFNVRLGDPETQALMLQDLFADFAETLAGSARGDMAGSIAYRSYRPSVCVVLAAHGYPGDVRRGDTITGIPEAEAAGATVFHAGTAMLDGQLVTAGGRVLGVTAQAEDLESAIAKAYSSASLIRFDGMHYRTDIGRKGLKHSPSRVFPQLPVPPDPDRPDEPSGRPS